MPVIASKNRPLFGHVIAVTRIRMDELEMFNFGSLTVSTNDSNYGVGLGNNIECLIYRLSLHRSYFGSSRQATYRRFCHCRKSHQQ